VTSPLPSPDDSSEELDDSPEIASTLNVPTMKDVARSFPGFARRTLLPVIVIIFWFSLPVDNGLSRRVELIADALFVLLWLVLFAVYLRRQVRSIHRAGSPQTQWIESLIVLSVLFVCIFARAYRILAIDQPDVFTQPMDTLNSYYYSLTILTTVGFGDIAPLTPGAKVLTMVQMVMDVALIGLVVKVLASAAQTAKEQVAAQSDQT